MCPAPAPKSLWIIAVLFAAIGVASAPKKAHADSITDPATTTTTFTFNCCNGVTAKVYDLQITIDLPAAGNPIIGITPLDPTCVSSFQNPFTATLTCGDQIATTDTIRESVTVNGTTVPKVLIATWSDVNGKPIGSATPIPEPASIDFVLGIGIPLLVVMRKRIDQRRRQ
jgi:hypothetical protein